jgi:mono/diheme cytochrome c family protein
MALTRPVALGAMAAVALGAGGVAVLTGREPPRDLARGAALYAERCAACHGANLEGAENWREAGPDGRLPAPPHDATGHTWHHPDDVLFAITKHGSAAVIGGGYVSDMPGFASVMSDAEIRDTLAYIKSTWPEAERAHQAAMTAQAEGG